MSVKKIKAEDLRKMKDKEGLILQGCGGSLDEWVDGINDMLTESDILLDDTKFKAENCSTFENEGLTCLMFPFSEDVKLNMGKLAMWRLQTHSNFGGKWLSDYVDNRLGGFLTEETAEQKKQAMTPLPKSLPRLLILNLQQKKKQLCRRLNLLLKSQRKILHIRLFPQNRIHRKNNPCHLIIQTYRQHRLYKNLYKQLLKKKRQLRLQILQKNQ